MVKRCKFCVKTSEECNVCYGYSGLSSDYFVCCECYRKGCQVGVDDQPDVCDQCIAMYDEDGLKKVKFPGAGQLYVDSNGWVKVTRAGEAAKLRNDLSHFCFTPQGKLQLYDYRVVHINDQGRASTDNDNDDGYEHRRIFTMNDSGVISLKCSGQVLYATSQQNVYAEGTWNTATWNPTGCGNGLHHPAPLAVDDGANLSKATSPKPPDRPVMSLEAHSKGRGVGAIAFSPDGTTFATGKEDLSGPTEVKLWHLPDGSLLRTLEGHTEGVRSIAFSPDGATVATSDADGLGKLWRTADGELLSTLNDGEELRRELKMIKFSPDGSTVATVGNDRGVSAKVWRVMDGHKLLTIPGHGIMVQMSCVAYSPDGTMLATGSRENTVILWRVSDGSKIQELPVRMSGITDLAFSPDGKFLVCVNENQYRGKIKLWDMESATVVWEKASDHGVSCVAFSPDGAVILTADYDDKTTVARLWAVSDGELLRAVKEEEESDCLIPRIACSPDGKTFATCRRNSGAVKLWAVL